MVAANGEDIAIAGRQYHGQVGSCHLEPGGETQRPSMRRMHRVQIEVPGQP
jgi:hypothetical protein